jgi:hypothetical protein
MECPLTGDTREAGAPTTYLEDVDGGPLGGDNGGTGELTICLQDLDGGPTRRRCQRPRSAHHLS